MMKKFEKPVINKSLFDIEDIMVSATYAPNASQDDINKQLNVTSWTSSRGGGTADLVYGAVFTLMD